MLYRKITSYIEEHLKHEAHGETDGGEIGVGAFGGFGDESPLSFR